MRNNEENGGREEESKEGTIEGRKKYMSEVWS